MLKIAALLFNTIALLIYQFLFTDPVTVTPNIPSSANAGSEFTVELTISKGSAGGFAKLQQDLPAGFTATEMVSNGASFTFTNQSVKFIWMALPADQEFKISYKVAVAAGVTGNQIIAGKFSYVTDNVKQSIEIAPSTINFGGGNLTNTVAATDTVSKTSPTSSASTTGTSEESSALTCSRNIPANANASDGFTVDINVNKGNLTGFAKFMETLPAGFTATAIESQGAEFSFVDQKAKFVWVTLPSQTEFKISYKVSVSADVSGDQLIDGVFSFIENDQTKKFTLPTSHININASTTSQPVAATLIETKEADKQPKELSATTIPSPQGKVHYKVQILALHKAKKADKVASFYKINETVHTEMAEGFTKYTVGSHNDYKEARDARESIKPNGVTAPFVTAYNSGKRITVQEALMITSQKWYR